jgi:hypothetical protein
MISDMHTVNTNFRSEYDQQLKHITSNITSLRQTQAPVRITHYDDQISEILLEIKSCRSSFSKLEIMVASMTSDIIHLQSNPDKGYMDEMSILKVSMLTLQKEVHNFQSSFDNKINGLAQF